MKKKVLITTSVIAVLVAGICVTLAFLTDKEEVKNTFTIGEVNISLNETAVNSDGKPIEGAERVIENNYHLLPGNSYIKDPTITVEAGSDESFIRMLVTLNKYKELKEIFGEDFEPGNFVTGYNSEKWIYIGKTLGSNNDVTYEFRYHKTVSGYNGETKENQVLEPLFETIEVPGEIEAKDLEKIADLEITVIGHAIQASGFDGLADVAWAAFAKQYNE